MEYKRFSSTNGAFVSKISIVLAVLSILLCGGLIYKVYDLQIQIIQLEKKFRSQESAVQNCSEKHSDLQEDLRQILNKSDGFHWITDATNWDYGDDDYDADDDFDYVFMDDYPKKTDASPSSTEETRKKREVLMKTVDGVPVNSESYEDTKKNKTGTSTSSAPGTYVRQSRVMRMEDAPPKTFRRIIKKPLVKSLDSTGQEQVTYRRRHRQRRVESNDRFRPAIHLNGDVYDLNGWSHHDRDHYKNWSREFWVQTLGMDQYFYLDNGYLRIVEPGLYLVYAQVLYFDEHDTNGFYVYKNDDIILQCTTTSHSSYPVRKSNTCYTAGVSHLKDGDKLRVHDIESYRYSIFRPGKSFFGAVKLSDVRRNL